MSASATQGGHKNASEPLPSIAHPNVLVQRVFHHKIILTRMWASAKRDGRPAEYRWRPLFNAAKFG